MTRASDADDPSKPTCIYCQLGMHDLCLYADRPTSCGCACPWLPRIEEL